MARSLRSQNRRLQTQLSKAQNAVEMHTEAAEVARAERDQQLENSAALEAYVLKLQLALQQAAQRAQLLEERVATSRHSEAMPPPMEGSGNSRPPATTCAEVADLSSSGDLDGAVSAVAVVAASSAHSTQIYEDTDSELGGEATPEVPASATMERGSDGSPVTSAPSPTGGASAKVAEYGGSPSTAGTQTAEEEEAATAAEGSSGKAASTEAGYLEDLWDFVVQGQLNQEEERPDFVRKGTACFPASALERAWARGVDCLSVRGLRLDASIPNQDDFLLAMRAPVRQGHVALYGVFDGHGPTGHRCAAFARSYLPECIFSDPDLFSRPKTVLRRAFAQTQQALLQQPFDVQVSGTTATLALVLGARSSSSGHAKLFIAHIGDSRVVLATRKEDHEPESSSYGGGAGGAEPFTVAALTREHRPDDIGEELRVQSQGGEVRRLSSNPNAGRVFVPGRNYPGLALTRALGDSSAVQCGVLAEPEVSGRRLRAGADVLLVLGTDGLFEFCSNEDVVAPLLRHGVATGILEEIAAESRQRWAANSYNQTIDDATIVAVSLLSHFG